MSVTMHDLQIVVDPVHGYWPLVRRVTGPNSNPNPNVVVDISKH